MSNEGTSLFKRLIELLGTRPFQPFQIRTADGRAYVVDSPRFFARSRRGDVVTYFTPEDDRAVTIRVKHIVSVEVANRPAA